MKLGFVVPRYGMEVLGGSESAARMLGERLVANKGFEVEVFTTCATEISWEDSYAPGTVDINGVTVHRFSSGARAADFATFAENPVRYPPERATAEACALWCEKQGPVCPEVIAAAEGSDADAIAFYPYLYYPTIYGVPRLGRRAILHAAAHDEPEIRLPIFRDVFAGAAGLVFHTYGERAFALDLFPVAHLPQIVLGLGIEEHPADTAAAAQSLGFMPGERPYVCCVGRVDNAKGTTLLAGMFLEYKERHPGPLTLVFVGPVVDRPVTHPDIVVTGSVSEGSKWGILAGSLGLISPSFFESFSLTVIEAWAAGVPVIVNGACEATREHCERSGGGLWFGGAGSEDRFADFERAVGRFERGEVEGLAEAGKTYADARFTWPVVIDRYACFLERVIAR